MRLLLCLAEHAGEVVSIDDLLNQVWPDVTVAPDSVYQAVTSLRRLLGDDPKQPSYIETVPRLGYRMIATVSPWADPSDASTGAHASAKAAAHTNAQTNSSPSSASEPPASASDATPATPKKSSHRLGARIALALGAAICVVLFFAFLFRGKLVNSNDPGSSAIAPQPQKSIAVLPFLDLTDAMNQEPFADGMTEELIDKLSKVPGLRVPSPTASFYFKGQLWPRSNGASQISIADIARILSVTYVLDGSVRKSGSRLRVDARMIRADNGYVVWSETYDRAFDDILTVQDDIAGKVAKALTASIDAAPNH
jgi:TolB-like protein/DNA-binding winged helix-turn-helix (wHTH) protein